ncbi:uncharacterized protein IL334_003377 [Kwoniella shivajii]|uniref:Uncharacterized protein n=1 Tax=Kwoniella shivajii TaxID=564305 RepID=A0ABZ1CXR7_9TREE|nr:hypothetical protein IL334_003377 [Kwoniella shivajii]
MTVRTPSYDVIPGGAVGIFKLGDNLWHVLELIRTHKTEYPKVEVSWDEDNPHKSAITIHLPYISLYFPHSPLYQLLSLISINTIPSQLKSTSSTSSPKPNSPPNSYSGLSLTYENQVLSSSHLPLTRARVGRLMGPTFISHQGDVLDFPGITFKLVNADLGDTPLGPREDIVNTIIIQPKDNEELEPTLISCVIQPNKGVTLGLEGDQIIPIMIGKTTSQDLMLDLGSPLRKFWKEDDRLEKMWGGSGNNKDKDRDQNGACFWNYFHYGLDFLVSKQGIVIKILCHSNIPGTPLFQRYARCPWFLPTESGASSSSGQLDSTSSSNAFRSNLSSSSSNISEEYVDEIRLTVPTPPPEKTNGNVNGNGTTTGKKKKRNGSPANAMMLDRLVEGGLDGVSGLSPSRLIGFDGLIIEEDVKSGGICSILVFRDDNSNKADAE